MACYNPAQVQRSYNLPALYARGVTGRGATIVIVDSFGSPARRGYDLASGVGTVNARYFVYELAAQASH